VREWGEKRANEGVEGEGEVWEVGGEGGGELKKRAEVEEVREGGVGEREKTEGRGEGKGRKGGKGGERVGEGGG